MKKIKLYIKLNNILLNNYYIVVKHNNEIIYYDYNNDYYLFLDKKDYYDITIIKNNIKLKTKLVTSPCKDNYTIILNSKNNHLITILLTDRNYPNLKIEKGVIQFE